MEIELSRFENILRAHSTSVTKARIDIFMTLLHASKPLKNSDIARLTPTVDKASVYRSLEVFKGIGITETIIRGWTPLTELAEPFKAHHHHLTCTQCGAIQEIENDTLEDVLNLVASRHTFTLTKHIVELSGICEGCSAKLHTK